MRIISFMWFKQNCKHLDENFDLEIEHCEYGHEHTRNKTAMYGDKIPYHPCMEKYCPILQNCEKEEN